MREDVSSIRDLVRHARRRIRRQAALDGSGIGAMVAAGAAVIVVILLRNHLATGGALFGGAGSLILAGAGLAALRRIPDEVIARRIDRASGLSDRLSSALAFERELSDVAPGEPLPATPYRTPYPPPRPERDDSMMRLAIRDAIRAVPLARIVEATPYHLPRHAATAVGCLAAVAMVAVLTLPRPDEGWIEGDRIVVDDSVVEASGMRSDDEALLRDLVTNLRVTAVRDHQPRIVQLADDIDRLLNRLERGEIDKLQLVDGLAYAERSAFEAGPGLSEDVTARLDDVLDAVRRLDPDASPPTGTPGAPPPQDPSPRTSGNAIAGAAGDVRGPALAGEPTSADEPTTDVFLPGVGDHAIGTGGSRRETINSAAARGFAAEPYQKVFTDYHNVVEDVMHGEKVPASYRHTIRRYFQVIRPKS